jgi:hypothetical protein
MHTLAALERRKHRNVSTPVRSSLMPRKEVVTAVTIVPNPKHDVKMPKPHAVSKAPPAA